MMVHVFGLLLLICTLHVLALLSFTSESMHLFFFAFYGPMNVTTGSRYLVLSAPVLSIGVNRLIVVKI